MSAPVPAAVGSPDESIPAPRDAAPAPAVGGSRRRLSWDVLRVGFVAMVVCYHATFIGPFVYHELLPRNVVFPHQIGASLLLVLSAYFVAVTVRRSPGRAGAVRWWWGRMARLVPAFLVATCAAWTALRLFAPEDWFKPNRGDLVANLLMLWQWNGLYHWDYVDGSYWTVPVQLMAFSVAVPLARSRWGRGTSLRVLMWAAVLIPLAQWPLRFASPGTLYASLTDGFGLHRWHLFVAGATVWMLATGRLRRWHGGALLVTCVLAHAVQTAYPGPDGLPVTDVTAVVGIGLGAVAILLAACGPDWDRFVPAPVSRGITRLAGISYGVFLTHQTLGYVLMYHLQQLGVGPTLQTGAMVLASVGFGWLLTHGVERPAVRALTARGARRHRVVAPAPREEPSPVTVPVPASSSSGPIVTRS